MCAPGIMLSRGVGGGELELQPPAAPSEASTGRHKLCQNAGDSFPLSKGIIIPPNFFCMAVPPAAKDMFLTLAASSGATENAWLSDTGS